MAVGARSTSTWSCRSVRPHPQGDAGEIVGVASTQGAGLTRLLAALAPRTGVSHAQRGLVSLGVWLGEDR